MPLPTNIHRIQNVFEAAVMTGRKVTIIGKNMARMVKITSNLAICTSLRLMVNQYGRVQPFACPQGVYSILRSSG